MEDGVDISLVGDDIIWVSSSLSMQDPVAAATPVVADIMFSLLLNAVTRLELDATSLLDAFVGTLRCRTGVDMCKMEWCCWIVISVSSTSLASISASTSASTVVSV